MNQAAADICPENRQAPNAVCLCHQARLGPGQDHEWVRVHSRLVHSRIRRSITRGVNHSEAVSQGSLLVLDHPRAKPSSREAGKLHRAQKTHLAGTSGALLQHSDHSFER